MLCSPLIPTKADLVELADSEIVPVTPPVEGQPAAAGWTDVWPLNAWKAKDVQEKPIPEPTTEPATEVAVVPASPRSTGVVRARRVKIQGQRVWVPSDNKLSVQAMWWGYRLYVPFLLVGPQWRAHYSILGSFLPLSWPF